MLQVNLAGMVISPAEVYETAEARQMQRFEEAAWSTKAAWCSRPGRSGWC
jgi:hypothetical protein